MNLPMSTVADPYPVPESVAFAHDQDSARTNGRANNLNFIRFVLALTVIVGHVMGPMWQPFYDRLGTGNIGYVAVDFFFLLSGYLITQSRFRCASTLEFLQKRVRRILPALLGSIV